MSGRMLHFIGYRMRITLDDGRTLVGRFLAFDKHMNLVLADTEEFRKTKKSKAAAAGSTGPVAAQEKRALGLVLLRGEYVVSLSVEAPPTTRKDQRGTAGRGRAAHPAGRGGAMLMPPPAATSAPLGLGGMPVRGVGGPAPAPGFGAPPGYGAGRAGVAMPPPPGYVPGGPPQGYGRGMPPPTGGFGRGGPPPG